ncbi:hypothetical protein M3650_28270 [Paenibacillus sp. MER TA 81-3]|uniref:hypothetical protein n=1 Tax=Paenibacillus sp. MER TA 81-3 TaxID=2939573 RepID=UPI0020404FB6|nr:hypothetical protein [Paenibacillus sp. MER TA 81-3]MCM3342416.1 hypothetical protein [Paenibacillus sp. MER TA 81-3]
MKTNMKMIMFSTICSMTLAISLFSTPIFAESAVAPSSEKSEPSPNPQIVTASFTQHDLDLLSRDMTGIPLDGDSYIIVALSVLRVQC